MNSIEISTATTATKFTVAFDGDNWTAFPEGTEIPDNWTIWATGLSWEEAHDAINASTAITLTHSVSGPDGEDIGLFSDAATATAFARDGETVSALETPVVRTDCRSVDGTDGFGVW